MRRALAILKYLPAVLCGLLVVAWGVSQLAFISIRQQLDDGQIGMDLDYGSLRAWRDTHEPLPGPLLVLRYRHNDRNGGNALGHFECIAWDSDSISGFLLSLPIPVLLALLLPLAIGPFNRFRFPLWSYFAFTALVALELAFYLR